MNPLKLFSPRYLFDSTPGPEFGLFWPTVVLFILIFLGSFFVKGQQHKLAARVREWTGIGFLLLFFRDQNVPYLGMRFWLVLWGVLLITFLIWKHLQKKTQAEAIVRTASERSAVDKYLPKAKKKKSRKA